MIAAMGYLLIYREFIDTNYQEKRVIGAQIMSQLYII